MTDPQPGSARSPLEAGTSPDLRPGRWRRGLVAGACYITGALVGALVGHEYYLPNPLALGEAFVLTDLRHGGAIVGAMCGALAAAFVTSPLARLRAGRFSVMVLAVAGVCLGYLLVESALVPGAVTLLVLALPWCFALRPDVARPHSGQ